VTLFRINFKHCDVLNCESCAAMRRAQLRQVEERIAVNKHETLSAIALHFSMSRNEIADLAQYMPGREDEALRLRAR